ncbi:MAG: MBL fold metallo-hydrolase [Gammaproteobacteria bacterium]|nr:MBL fold metallo-hydrolase [Gammaproteobacteria bacterium]
MKHSCSRRHFLDVTASTLSTAAISSMLPTLTSAQQEVADITLVELSHAWVFQGAGCNVFALPGVNEDGLLMIDGGLEAHSDKLLEAVFNTIGQDRIHTLVNTHWHPEQTGSNERLGAEGAVIIAHEKTKMFLENSVMSSMYEGRYGPQASTGLPSRIFREGGTMKFAGQEIMYGYLPAAHSDSDIWLYFPMLDTLVAGGPVTAGEWPVLDIRHGSWMGGLLKAYETLAQVVSADTVVVPAHGPILSGTDILRMRAMYTNLHLDLAEQLNLGMGPDNIINMGLLDDYIDDFGDPTRFLDHAHRSLQLAYVPD